MGWGLPREGVEAEKFVPSLPSLSSFVFRREESLDYPYPPNEGGGGSSP